MHETLLSEEELLRAEDMGDFFRVRSEWFGDYAKYETSGIAASLPAGAYTSENTTRLDRAGTQDRERNRQEGSGTAHQGISEEIARQAGAMHAADIVRWARHHLGDGRQA